MNVVGDVLGGSLIASGTFATYWSVAPAWQRRRRQIAEAHRPDYAKIRRLEIELGMREPDPPPVTEPLVRATPLTPLEKDGERWLAEVGPALDITATLNAMTGQVAPAHTMNEYLSQETRNAAKWQTCPVCLRQHEGRCAG